MVEGIHDPGVGAVRSGRLPAVLFLLFLFAFTASADTDPCSWAGTLADTKRAEEVERELFRDPNQLPPTLRSIGEALDPNCAQHAQVSEFAVALAKAYAERLGDTRPPWTRNDMAMLLAYQLVDPVRFAEKAGFRKRVLPLIPREMDGSTPLALRERQIRELNGTIGFDYDSAEKTELAWKLVPRASASRRFTGTASQLRIADDYAGRIEATFFVLPSSFFPPWNVEAFLSAQRSAAPNRRLVVISDREMKEALGEKLDALHVEWIDAYGRDFTPWPRDPFTVARRPDGGVALLTRPNVQEGREEDGNMARQIISGASDSFDRALGRIEWTVGSTHFHNGQVLLTPDAAWITMHALETRNLERMQRRAISRKQFDTTAGIQEYLAQCRKTIAELEKLYGRSVRLVHPLPDSGTLAERKKVVKAIYGGGDFDLDSIVTLVPRANGKWTAFVADITLDKALLDAVPAAEWERFRSAYGIAGTLELPGAIAEAQTNARAKALDAFVDLIAASLKRDGFDVERLPLLLVPISFLADQSTLKHRDFVVGWNNIVFERGADSRFRGTAFASYLDSIDASVIERFRAADVDLRLLPPLVRSVILNGAYRCVSNSVRDKTAVESPAP